MKLEKEWSNQLSVYKQVKIRINYLHNHPYDSTQGLPHAL